MRYCYHYYLQHICSECTRVFYHVILLLLPLFVGTTKMTEYLSSLWTRRESLLSSSQISRLNEHISNSQLSSSTYPATLLAHWSHVRRKLSTIFLLSCNRVILSGIYASLVYFSSPHCWNVKEVQGEGRDIPRPWSAIITRYHLGISTDSSHPTSHGIWFLSLWHFYSFLPVTVVFSNRWSCSFHYSGSEQIKTPLV